MKILEVMDVNPEHDKMNGLLQELENLALQTWGGKEALQVCLKMRSLKQAAFNAGIEWEKEHNNPLNGIAIVKG